MLLQPCQILLFRPYLQESRPFICRGRLRFHAVFPPVVPRIVYGWAEGRATHVGTQVYVGISFSAHPGLAFRRTCRAGIASVQDEPVRALGIMGSGK